jgi:hypothetical protein
MDHRIRLALQNGSTVKLGGKSGEVEADETFIGGKARRWKRMKNAIWLVVGCLLFFVLWQVFWRTSFAIMDLTKNAFVPFVLIAGGIYWILGRRRPKG